MTRIIFRGPTGRPARSAVMLLAALWVLSATLRSLPAQEPGGNGRITYQLTETWTEGNSGSTTLHVQQVGDAALARFAAGGEIALVSNPRARIISAGPDPFSSTPFFVEVSDAPPGIAPGQRFASASGGIEVVESLRYNIEPGLSDSILLGHVVTRSVLTIEFAWDWIQEDGSRTSNRSTGRTELWTAPSLPFSWIPYTFPQGFSMAAVPLSFHHPHVASYVLAQIAPELQALGLLMHANTRSSTILDPDGNNIRQDFTREVELTGLQEDASSFDMTALDRTVLSPSRYEALLGGMLRAGRSCQRAPAGASALQLQTSDASWISGTGRAWINPESGELVLGSLAQPFGCIVVVMDPTGPQHGEYALAPGARAWDVAAAPKAAAYYLRGTEESSQLTFIEAGKLTIKSAEDGTLRAELRGSGWTVNRTPGAASVIEDVAVSLTFEVGTP